MKGLDFEICRGTCLPDREEVNTWTTILLPEQKVIFQNFWNSI